MLDTINKVGANLLRVLLLGAILFTVGAWIYLDIKVKPSAACASWDSECRTELSNSRFLESY